jgi:hypothetical protein
VEQSFDDFIATQYLNSLKELGDWFIAPTIYPYDGVTEHLVVWYRGDRSDQQALYRSASDFFALTMPYQQIGYTIMRNGITHQSIPHIPHAHLLMFVDYDHKREQIIDLMSTPL